MPSEPGRLQQRGSIVNCASVNSLMTMQGVAAYTASKHAVHGITKTVGVHSFPFELLLHVLISKL